MTPGAIIATWGLAYASLGLATATAGFSYRRRVDGDWRELCDLKGDLTPALFVFVCLWPLLWYGFTREWLSGKLDI